MSNPQDPHGQQDPYGHPSGPFPQQSGGYPPPGYGPSGYGGPPQSQDQGMAVGSLVCSIVGIFICPAVLSIVGIVLGHIAVGKADRGEAGGRGMAMAGLIIGYVTIALIIVAVIVAIAIGAFDR
ncbi:DUF4190 domain-containing protein [Amycolatopsis magusensis]|uniref:DUF4190 domain-containing protein n=1 Tax=Amycolatopsis magusensis TaxID=882444 RepID=A0ABS4PN04_9PSEU|nr:DUF4190 domain-containing protein [Amycolatopsis magusensis]MBP2180810.1 hypothetical protein [Amycolatopsis magusensis]MDI5977459.1 DUF4190 domain-containing protein [Amycolatopsis magusensis]